MLNKSSSGPGNPGHSAVPEQVGRYRILRPLGEGGMGSVFLAEDTLLKRQVALKVPLDVPEGRRDEVRERFLREARSAAGLDHPYICRVYDFGEVDGWLYLAMAFVEGQPLSALVRPGGIPTRQAAALVGKLALAMHEAHARGVVHRDLKPRNVMIRKVGTKREPVVVDFGLARLDQDDVRLTSTGQVVGTPAYMAPEQLRGDPDGLGPPCDVYAMGVMLYELLTGRLPFQGPLAVVVAQALTQDAPPPSTYREGLDPALDAVCLKAMARDPARRYASMMQLAEALTRFLRDAPRSDDPPPGAAGGDRDPAGTDSLHTSSFRQVGGDPAPPPPPTPLSAPAAPPDIPAAPGLRKGRTRWVWPAVTAGALAVAAVAAAWRLAPIPTPVNPPRRSLAPAEKSPPVPAPENEPFSTLYRSAMVSALQTHVQKFEQMEIFAARRPGGYTAEFARFRPRLESLRNKVARDLAGQADVSKVLEDMKASPAYSEPLTLGVTEPEKDSDQVAFRQAVIDLENVLRASRGNGGSSGRKATPPVRTPPRDVAAEAPRPLKVPPAARPEFDPRRPPMQMELFNGADLTGLGLGGPQVPDIPSGLTEFRTEWWEWWVKGGVLNGRGRTPRPGLASMFHLTADAEPVTDFQLTVEARLGEGQAADLLFRNKVRQLGPSSRAWVGYAVALRGGPNTDAGGESGELLDFVNGAGTKSLQRPSRDVTRPGEWFTLEVLVGGGKIHVKIGDEDVVDYTDPSNRYPDGGRITIRPRETDEVQFRRISLVRLTPSFGPPGGRILVPE